MSRNIPKRWIPYKACGEIIEGTRIICFKVPLQPHVQKNIDEITEIWDVKSVLERIPGLKAVIDLTNTARYYDPKEFEKAGVAHKKIMMAGRLIPPDGQVKEFMDAVDSFVEEDGVPIAMHSKSTQVSPSNAVIGVHCTHGLNRTGYMVCRYMRDRLGIPPREAIERFEKARGYEIERDNYLADILGKQPPPPFFGNGHEDDPIPAGKTRSTSLSAFGVRAEDQNTEPDNQTKHDNTKTKRDNHPRQERQSRPRKRRTDRSRRSTSNNNTRNKSSNDQDRSKRKKDDKEKIPYGNRLNDFAYDYKFDY